MAGIYTDFWRIIKPAPNKNHYSASNPEAAKLYSNFSWYTKVMKGASSRFSKYAQYRNMDNDVFVSRALDTIAEEMTSTNVRTNLPFEIEYQNESDKEIPENITMTVRAALRHWTEIQDLGSILFDIARNTVKYGDCMFRKTSDFKRWQYVDPGDIIGISINADTGRAEHYHVRVGEKNQQGAFGDIQLVPAAGMVHFTLSSSMGENGPFGESVLFPCVRAFRHLSLLEDSVIIYRIVRAPERRVFFLDVGNMPPQRVKAYLESVKNEMKQKRIPNESGGQEKTDSVMNPMSMVEDYFFAQTPDGRGGRVETLSGGENLGEIADLNFFQNKFLQGLRIPSSYMRGGSEGIQISDGKVGVAYIEELRFANYVARLQTKINNTFDNHFKAYMKSAGLNIDPMIFKIRLCDPHDFKDFKQAEVDEKLISNFNSIKDVKTMSERFKFKYYLGLNEDELQENEVMLRQERNIPEGGIDETLNDIRMMYDPKWDENRPDIKVDESYDDHTTSTAPVSTEEDPDEEVAPDGDKGSDKENPLDDINDKAAKEDTAKEDTPKEEAPPKEEKT